MTTPRINFRLVLSLFCLALLASCSKPDAPAPQTPAVAVTPSTALTTPSPTPTANLKTVNLHLVVLDMNGAPLPNLEPIATSQPNAFDKPVVKGELTGADGKATLAVPANQWLFVRAWDPAKRLFANNFYEVLPGEAPVTEEMKILMLPAASLRLEVMGPDGAPLAEQFLGIMMSHPTRGPWWPSESKTDLQGFAVFNALPPGKYIITVETRDGRHLDLPETTLMPGQLAKVDPIALR